MSGRWMTLAVCAALAACARPEREGRDTLPARQRASEPAPAAQDTPRRISPDVPPHDTRPWIPVVADTFRLPPAPPARSASPAQAGEWTAGVVEGGRKELRPVTLRAIRTGGHEGWDRVVFEFEGGKVPGYRVEYVDRPITRCGSGNTTQVAGAGWIQVRFTPARAHDDAGRTTVRDRERKLSLPVLRELETTCDFEGEVTVVLGVARPNRFRVMELSSPARLVVDVRR
jgi:hypothetical protein